MAQPYDLSGFVSLTNAVNRMLFDQRHGTVKFAGGNQSWLTGYGGSFKAILAVGGSLATTTTNQVRLSFNALKTCFDLLASGSGRLADIPASQQATNYTSALVTGSSSLLTLSAAASGAVANTNYDLSGLASLQTTANTMLTDAEALTTHFVNSRVFTAVLSPGKAAVSTTMPAVRQMLADIRATFDLLAQ